MRLILILKDFPFTPEVLKTNFNILISHTFTIFNILIYTLDFYVVPVFTTPVFT
jgi:hypothetical protein